jgi:WD40-like Beta Propeller Repeat
MNELSEFERQLAAGIEAIVGPRRPVDSMALARMAVSRAPIRTSMRSRVSTLIGRGPRALGRRHGDQNHVIWTRRNLMLLLAVVVTMALIGGAIGAGSGLLRLPAVVPPYLSPQPTSSPRTSPSASASVPAGPLGGGLIVAHDFQNQHDGPFNVFLIDAGSGDRTRLGTLPGLLGRAYAFQWSADRSHILIPDALGPMPALQAPTEAARRYTFICCKDLHGAGRWVLSPLGDRIAGVREDARGERALEIVILDVNGNGTVRLPLPTGVGAVGNGVSWAPDGSAVVIEGCRPCNGAGFGQRQSPVAHYHLFIVPTDGSPVRELLDDTGGGPGAPAWSPDGSSIAVVRLICDPGTVMPFCGGAPGVLETVQVANGAVKRMGNVGPADFAPVWSPDGRRIAYTDDTGLSVIGADGTGLTRLVGGEATHAQWSPDGSWILFRSGNSLRIVPSDGGESRLVGPYPGGAW